MKAYRTALQALLALSIATTGCATIIKGTSQDVSVSSTPAGASVLIRSNAGADVFQGTTPASAKLAKKREYTVTVSNPGYEDVRVAITQSFEGWFIGNLLCGGIIGGVIDAVDGAMWNLEPNMINVTLRAAGGGRAVLRSPNESASCESTRSDIADVSESQGDATLYAVFHARDAEGQLRSLSVPMVRKVPSVVR